MSQNRYLPVILKCETVGQVDCVNHKDARCEVDHNEQFGEGFKRVTPAGRHVCVNEMDSC